MDNEYPRTLIETSLDPLVTISHDGKISDVNEATVKVTGVPRKQLIGTDFAKYFTEPEKATEGYKKVLADGSVSDYPLTIKHVNGNETQVLYNASVYRDENGEVAGVFAAARDVTEINKAKDTIKILHGILPICSFCKKIRDDKGAWRQLEEYIHEHSEAEFTHGLCEDCAIKHYGGYLSDK